MASKPRAARSCSSAAAKYFVKKRSPIETSPAWRTRASGSSNLVMPMAVATLAMPPRLPSRDASRGPSVERLEWESLTWNTVTVSTCAEMGKVRAARRTIRVSVRIVPPVLSWNTTGGRRVAAVGREFFVVTSVPGFGLLKHGYDGVNVSVDRHVESGVIATRSSCQGSLETSTCPSMRSGTGANVTELSTERHEGSSGWALQREYWIRVQGGGPSAGKATGRLVQLVRGMYAASSEKSKACPERTA